MLVRSLLTISLTVACGARAADSDAPDSEATPVLRLSTNVTPIRVRAELEIDPRTPGFRGAVELDVDIRALTKVVWLNGTNLVIKEAQIVVDGIAHQVEARLVGDDFIALESDERTFAGPATLRLRYSGTQDDERTMGLYRVKEPDGTWYSYTMFEPMMARRVFPSFDEPNFKLPWTLSFRLKQGDMAVANTPSAQEQSNSDGTRTVVFQETKPLPSYLIAFVVGPFDIVEAGTVGKDNVPLRFIVPPGHRDELDHAKQATPKIVATLEEMIGIRYPFAKLDVAVVARGWGSMEHPGILAMGQPHTLIARGEETIGRRLNYTNIATHELCHYWFGDLVTMAWWDDIWLNESFGTWCDLKATHILEPTWGYDAKAIRLREPAFKADEDASVKRIREPANSKGAVESSFEGGITYDKGAAVIQMFEHWVGPSAFRRIIRTYLRKYAWGSATSADFAGALNAEVDGLGTAMMSFVDQPGAPKVSMSLECEPKRPATLRLSQQHFTPLGASARSTKGWQIPVCVRYGAASAAQEQCTLLSSAKDSVQLEGACPAWLIGNARGTGYYRTAYNEPTANAAAKAAYAYATRSEKIAIVSDQLAAVRAGDIEAAPLMRELARLIKEPGRDLTYYAAEIVSMISELVPDTGRAAFARAVRDAFGTRARAVGWKVRPGESVDDSFLRGTLLTLLAIEGNDVATIEKAQAIVSDYLRDPKSAPRESLNVALRVAARHGNGELFERYLAAARTTSDRSERARYLTPLGSFQQAALAERALALVASDEFDLRETRRILRDLAISKQHRRRLWEFIKKNFDSLAARMTRIYIPVLVRPSAVFCDQAGLEEADAFFRSKIKAYPFIELTLRNELDEIRQCIAFRARHKEPVARFFEQAARR